MLAQKTKAFEDRRYVFLDEVAEYFNEPPHTILRWLILGKFPGAARLTGGWIIPREDVLKAEGGKNA